MLKRIVRLSIVCALYVALSLISAPIAYGIIQFRIAEVLVLLCFYKKDYGISIVLGCIIVNLFSPTLGLIDVAVGTIHSLLSVIIISHMKNLFLASLVPSFLMIIIACEICFFTETSDSLLYVYALLFFEETAVVCVLGVPLFTLLSKNKVFKEKIL